MGTGSPLWEHDKQPAHAPFRRKAIHGSQASLQATLFLSSIATGTTEAGINYRESSLQGCAEGGKLDATPLTMTSFFGKATLFLKDHSSLEQTNGEGEREHWISSYARVWPGSGRDEDVSR